MYTEKDITTEIKSRIRNDGNSHGLWFYYEMPTELASYWQWAGENEHASEYITAQSPKLTMDEIVQKAMTEYIEEKIRYLLKIIIL